MARKRKTRAHLTRDKVMDAALQIADEQGFDGVTIRSLASAVGVPPMTLYGHFADKNALYDGMRERLASRQIVSESAGNWQRRIEHVARNFFETLRAHPNWLPLFGRGSRPPAPALAYLGDLVALMRADGLSLEHVIHGYASALSLAFGTAHVERMILGPTDRPLASRKIALLQELLPRLPEGTGTTLTGVATQLEKLSFDDVFDFGLRSIIRGIEARRKATR